MGTNLVRLLSDVPSLSVSISISPPSNTHTPCTAVYERFCQRLPSLHAIPLFSAFGGREPKGTGGYSALKELFHKNGHFHFQWEIRRSAAAAAVRVCLKK